MQGSRMRAGKANSIAFWVAAIAAPLAACALAVSQLPDAASIPLHWTSGKADRWGSPDELAGGLWFVGAVMAVLNLALAAGYAFSDRLYDAGIAHGASRDGVRQVCAVGAGIVVVMTCVVLVAATSMAGNAV